MMISSGLSKLLRNRLFWIGFGIVAVVDIVNNLNHLYPNVPQIPIVNAFSFREYLVERPWNAMSWVTINLYPFIIGIAFFLPTDLAFSCWFFFLFYNLQLVVTSAIGIRDVPGLPFPGEPQAFSALCFGSISGGALLFLRPARCSTFAPSSPFPRRGVPNVDAVCLEGLTGGEGERVWQLLGAAARDGKTVVISGAELSLWKKIIALQTGEKKTFDHDIF